MAIDAKRLPRVRRFVQRYREKIGMSIQYGFEVIRFS